MSEDLYSDRESFTEYTPLTRDKLVNVLSTKQTNHDGTILCFDMFYKVIYQSVFNQIFDVSIESLSIIENYIRRLRKTNSFSDCIFFEYLMDHFLTIPLQLVWWLKKNDVIIFGQYWNERRPENLIEDLTNLFKTDNKKLGFDTYVIFEDILNELMCGLYAPRISLHKSNLWHKYCKTTLNELMEQILKADCDSIFIEYVKRFPRNPCFAAAQRKFFNDVLIKFLTSDPEQFSLNDIYKYQYLFTYEAIPKNTLAILDTVFCYIKTLEFLRILDMYPVNWKHFLDAITVCLRKTPNGYKVLEEKAMVYLDNTFKGGKIKELIKSFLLIRQGSIACADKTYESWYRTTFGLNTTYKTSTNATFFKYFIECLTKLLNFEPKCTLQTHILCSLRAPMHCNSLIFDYKKMARRRSVELKTCNQIMMSGKKLPVLHVIEDCQEKNAIPPFIKEIINSQHEALAAIMTDIRRNQQHSVQELFVEEYDLNNEDYKSPDPGVICLDDSDSDFTQS